MLKEENAELLTNGERVESDRISTADSETMKVEIPPTFDATSFDGKQLVTFEELYDSSNPDESKKATEHKGIEDKGQTITLREKPEKPETPRTSGKPNRPSDSPRTGDNADLYRLLALLLASGAGLAGVSFYKRRRTKGPQSDNGMVREKSRSPPKSPNGRLLLIPACLLLTCKNTDSQGCVSIDLTLYYLGDHWYFPNHQNKRL